MGMDMSAENVEVELRAARSLTDIRMMLAQSDHVIQALIRDDQLRYERTTRTHGFIPGIENAAAHRTDRILRAADRRTQRGLSNK